MSNTNGTGMGKAHCDNIIKIKACNDNKIKEIYPSDALVEFW